MSFRVRDTTTIAFQEAETTKEDVKEMKKFRKKSRKKEKEKKPVNVPQSGGLRMKPDFTGMSDYF
jgi:hypothetical protein